MYNDPFFYALFQRNIGIFTVEEQNHLKKCTVALAGVGGVGGIQLVTLVRTGIGRFSIADPETYEPSNINRQYGATLNTVGKNKAAVMEEIVHAINPMATVQTFPTGVNENNVDQFLQDADIVIDSIEYCALSEKILLAKKTRERNLFLVTSPTWGYGASLIVFSPYGVTFEEFFGLTSDIPVSEKKKQYADRLFPVKPGYLDPYPYALEQLEKTPVPVLCLGTLLSAVLAAAEVISILLHTKDPITAPHVIQLDVFRRSFDIITNTH
jgi:molybdopterin/thiamine biosynthesis adenylyltransferase